MGPSPPRLFYLISAHESDILGITSEFHLGPHEFRKVYPLGTPWALVGSSIGSPWVPPGFPGSFSASAAPLLQSTLR